MRNDLGVRLKHIRAHRTQPEMGRVMGVAQRTYASYERSERTPDAAALAPLVAEGWNANWLLTGEGPERLDAQQVAGARAGYGSQDLSGETLSIAVELADEALKGLWLPRRRYYDLVALIYDGLAQGLPYAEVIDIARPAAKSLAMEDDDDGKAGLAEQDSDAIGGRQAGAAKR